MKYGIGQSVGSTNIQLVVAAAGIRSIKINKDIGGGGKDEIAAGQNSGAGRTGGEIALANNVAHGAGAAESSATRNRDRTLGLLAVDDDRAAGDESRSGIGIVAIERNLSRGTGDLAEEAGAADDDVKGARAVIIKV